MSTPSTTLLKTSENIYMNADVATVGPVIKSLMDSTMDEKSLHIAPNVSAIVFDSTLLIKRGDSSVGIYFTRNEESATPVKVSLVAYNTESEITIQIPPLVEGQHWLSATTQAGASYGLTKGPCTYKLSILLAVDAGSNNEGPDEI